MKLGIYEKDGRNFALYRVILPLLLLLSSISRCQSCPGSDQSLSTLVQGLLVDNPGITRLDCFNVGLTGTVPKEIGNLLELTKLSIISNDGLNGVIPVEIGKLTKLTSLSLQRLPRITGPIPSQVGRLSNLISLKTFRSTFGGQIPKELGKLSKLKYLVLAGNRLTGRIPTELGELKGLVDLEIEKNDFIGTIPTELTELTLLRGLRLDNNDKLTGTLPDGIGKLTSLQSIWLENIAISGTIPSQVGLWKNLNFMRIQSTNMNGTIPSEIAELTGLKNLWLPSNRFTGPIPKIQQLTNLERLDLEFNQLTGNFPTGLNKLTKAGWILLGYNKLSGKFPSTDIGEIGTGLREASFYNKNVTFECDETLLSWYSEVYTKDKFRHANVCDKINIYGELELRPFILRLDPDAPGKHPIILVEKTKKTANSIDIQWIYNGDMGSNASSTTAIRRLAKSCEVFRLPALSSSQSILGFKITWNTNSICLLSDEIRQLDHFSHNITQFVNPATEYQIRIQPFYLKIENNLARPLFGIQSGTVLVKTNDDLPTAGPSDVTSSYRSDSVINLNWSQIPSSASNGRVIAYTVECDKCRQKFHSTAQTSISISGLSPGKEYGFSIRGATSAGVGIPSDKVMFRTCGAKLYSNVSDSTCTLSEAGYFFSGGVAIACSLFSKEIDPTSCLNQSIESKDLILNKGYWRPSIYYTSGLNDCPNLAFCLGEISYRDIPNSDQYCSLGHTGVYCSKCSDGYKFSMHNGCVVCSINEESEAKTKLILVLSFAAILFIIFQLRMISKAGVFQQLVKLNQSDRMRFIKQMIDKLSCFFAKFVSTKLRIFVVTTQILFSFQNTFSTRSADIGNDNLFISLVTLNLGNIVPALQIHCFSEDSFFKNLLVATLVPLAVVLLIWLTYGILHKCVLERTSTLLLYQEAFGSFLMITFYVYEPVSRIIVQTFLCETIQIEKEGGEFLRADYRISCDSAEYEAYFIYACFMVLLYPLGIFCTYMYLLKSRRQLLLQSYQTDNINESEKEKIKTIAFLTRPYKKEYYWFEIYELVRRLGMVPVLSFVVTLEDYTGKRYVAEAYAFLVVILSVFLLEMTHPYKLKSDWFYALLSLILLSVATQITLFSELHTEKGTYDKQEYIKSFYLGLFWLEISMFLLFVAKDSFMIKSLNDEKEHFHHQSNNEGRIQGKTFSSSVENFITTLPPSVSNPVFKSMRT